MTSATNCSLAHSSENINGPKSIEQFSGFLAKLIEALHFHQFVNPLIQWKCIAFDIPPSNAPLLGFHH